MAREIDAPLRFPGAGVAAHPGPDIERAQAFLPTPYQGVSYKPNTWHGGLNVFDKPARLTVFQWLDGTAADEEIVSVPTIRVIER